MSILRQLPDKTYCYRADDRRESDRPDRSDPFSRPGGMEEEEESLSPIEAIYCRECGRTVTGRDQKIAVQGSHAHTFFNPAGIVFELGCFSAAPGCHRVGEASSDFTWFAGFFWSCALCSGCNSHLGWFFEMGDRSFYGLILAKIRE